MQIIPDESIIYAFAWRIVSGSIFVFSKSIKINTMKKISLIGLVAVIIWACNNASQSDTNSKRDSGSTISPAAPSGNDTLNDDSLKKMGAPRYN